MVDWPHEIGQDTVEAEASIITADRKQGVGLLTRYNPPKACTVSQIGTNS